MSVPKQTYEGKYWAFVANGKLINLQLFADDVDGSDLVAAYGKHAQRLPPAAAVEFVYVQDKGNKIIRRVPMAEILAYEEELRQIKEDAAQQDEEARQKRANGFDE